MQLALKSALVGAEPVVHGCNPSSREVKARGIVRPAWTHNKFKASIITQNHVSKHQTGKAKQKNSYRRIFNVHNTLSDKRFLNSIYSAIPIL